MTDLASPPSLAAADVAEYLRANPGFLAGFPDLATRLVVPRERGSAASLAAYQLEALRTRNRQLDQRLAELVAIAEDNEQRMVRVHALTVGLLRDNDLTDVLKGFVAALNEDFHTPWVRLILFRAGDGLPHAEWLQCIAAGSGAMPAFRDFLTRDEPECGRLAPEKLEPLFGAAAGKVRSAALMKIGDAGMLAIGSDNVERFHPGIGTLFLKLIAQALAATISRFPAGAE